MRKVLAVQSVSGERSVGKMCLPRQKAHGIYIYMKSGEDRRCLLRQKATKEGKISGIYCANSCACFLPSVPDSSENVRTQAAIASRPAACAEGKEVSFVSGFLHPEVLFLVSFFFFYNLFLVSLSSVPSFCAASLAWVSAGMSYPS